MLHNFKQVYRQIGSIGRSNGGTLVYDVVEIDIVDRGKDLV